MSSANAVISVQWIRKRLGTVSAADGLDFKVLQGCLCGFPGRNGAGKTITNLFDQATKVGKRYVFPHSTTQILAGAACQKTVLGLHPGGMSHHAKRLSEPFADQE